MDRDLYKAFAETMRMPTFKVLLAVKAGYYVMLYAFLIDCSNAFQTTRTDQPAAGEAPMPYFYVWPAPGFDKYTKAGKRMAFGKEVKCKAKPARTVVKAFAVAALKKSVK